MPRAAPPGEHFNYNTGETHLLGSVLRAAIGNNLSRYLTHTIWQPFGMEAEANWMLVEAGGAEHGGCCLSATLRDYGRIGLFALRNGKLRDGTSVLPDGWISAATTPSAAADAHGYLWWLRGEGVYAALAIFGQAIWVDPVARLVVVTHGVWPRPTGQEFSAHRDAFIRAVTHELLCCRAPGPEGSPLWPGTIQIRRTPSSHATGESWSPARRPGGIFTP